MSLPHSRHLFNQSAHASARQTVTDPHHFVLFQHGVFGHAGEFENVITDLFIHHDLSLREACEAAAEKAGQQTPEECAHRGEREHDRAWCESSVDETSGIAGGTGRQGSARRGDLPREGGTGIDVWNSFGHEREPPRNAVDRCDDDQHKQCSLKCTYPFNKRGRLYQTGNLVCFAPGSNNFLGTSSGTLPCARRMLKEFLPVFSAWLNCVEAAREAEDELLAGGKEDEETASGGGSKGLDTARDVTPQASEQLPDERIDPDCGQSGDMQSPSQGSNQHHHRHPVGTGKKAMSANAATLSTVPTNSSSPSGLSGSRQAPSTPQQKAGRGQESRLLRRLPVCFSCVGHSFGGLILREFLYLLCADTIELARVDRTLFAAVLSLRLRMMKLCLHLETFLTIATPHCGTTECLWWPLYLGAWCLSKLQLSGIYDELIVSENEAALMERLTDAPHLTSLKLFRRRTLFANTRRDLLVGFGTSSLLYETDPDSHRMTKGYGHGRGVTLCASAFESDDAELSAAIHLPANAQKGDISLNDRAPTSSLEPSRWSWKLSLSPPLPACASHTLLDIWEFGHTRDTTTLTPVDPLINLADTAITNSAGVLAGTGDSNRGSGGQQSREEDNVGGNGKSAGGCWLPRIHPHPDGNGDGIDENGAADALASDNNSVISPSPTRTQVPFSEAVSPKELRQKLCAVLPPSLSATVTNLPAGKAPSAAMSAPESGVVDPASRSVAALDGKDAASDSVSSSSVAALLAAGTVSQQSADGASHGDLRDPLPTTFAHCSTTYPETSHVPRAFPSSSNSSKNDASRRNHYTTIPLAVLKSVPACFLTLPVRIATASLRKLPTAVVNTARFAFSLLRCRAPFFGKLCSGAPVALVAEELCRSLSSPPPSSASLSDFAQREDESEEEDRQQRLCAHVDRRQRSRLTPKAIAHELRRDLDWRVRAIRSSHLIPIAHVLPLGNWAWAGASPDLVKAVAEEIACIL